jgi:chromosome segregation ATPase
MSHTVPLRSLNEVEKSIAIKGELANVMNKRLGLSLRIPNSAISSSEALKLLEGLNTVDSVTLLEAVRLKQPLIHDINCLQMAEKDFDDKHQVQLQAEKQMEQTREALWRADTKARQAVEKEIEARRALEEAKREVIATRQALLDWKNIYDSAENQHRKATHDVDKVSLALMRKQERVRTALRRKEEEGLGLQESASSDTLCLADIERLRKEEEYLRAESARLEDRVKRLRSRARKLRRRSEQMKQGEVVQEQ